jgi:hypothetical protein
VLRNSDIRNRALSELEAHGTTMRTPPPGHLHRPASNCLHALSLARTIGPGHLAGMVVNPSSITSAAGNLMYDMPVGASNKITFEENGGYALQVDWI